VCVTNLRVHLFGPLEASLGADDQQLRFPSLKTKWLLGYLLLNRETYHPRDKLADLWWGAGDTNEARHSLRTALWRLRHVLEQSPTVRGSFLIVKDDEVGFNIQGDYWLDVEEFERLCAQARWSGSDDDDATANALRQAIALYRDDLLPGCYEDWCFVERERLRQLYLSALSRLAAFHARRKEYAEGIACCQLVLAREPMREEIQRDLIRLYLAVGRPQDAVRQFQACAAVLKRELGIEPMAETTALVRDWLAHNGQGNLTQTPAAPRPAAPVHLSGEELQNILIQFSNAVEKVSLVGMQMRRMLERIEQIMAHPRD